MDPSVEEAKKSAKAALQAVADAARMEKTAAEEALRRATEKLAQAEAEVNKL